MKEPNYLVLTTDGVIHAYWNVDILRIDLATLEGAVKIYRLSRELGARRYYPIDPTSLRSEQSA